MTVKWFKSEEALLEGLRQDDERAFAQAYRENWELILRFLLKNQGTRQDAEDIYQEAFLNFCEKLRNDPTFQLTCQIRTYLYAICRHMWLYRLRKHRNVFVVDVDDPVLEGELERVTVGTEDSESLPDEPVLLQAIDQLGDPCRTVLIGFYYKKLSMEEIARVVGRKDAANAKILKFKCMDRLKKQFASYNG